MDEKLESIKIGDFGFSSVIGDEHEDAACGSLDYAAPEILGARSRPGPEGDVWALGMLLRLSCFSHHISPVYLFREVSSCFGVHLTCD